MQTTSGSVLGLVFITALRAWIPRLDVIRPIYTYFQRRSAEKYKKYGRLLQAVVRTASIIIMHNLSVSVVWICPFSSVDYDLLSKTFMSSTYLNTRTVLWAAQYHDSREKVTHKLSQQSINISFSFGNVLGSLVCSYKARPIIVSTRPRYTSFNSTIYSLKLSS